jgi:hypothetical protein
MFTERITEGEENERVAALALYRDAGDWARHFSTVRLTIAMVLVFGGMGLNFVWSFTGYTDLFWAGAILWSTGLGLFYYFSFLVRKMQNRQREIRNALYNQKYALDSNHPWTDVPFIVLLVMSVVAILILCFL